MTTTIKSQFTVRDRVHVDGCKSLVGIITAVQWRSPEHVCYEVSWVTNGESKAPLIEGWRLTAAEP